MDHTDERRTASRDINILASEVGFAEGPVVTPSGGIFVTSIDHGRVYRITESGAEVFADLGGGANGAALAEDGTLYVAQNGGAPRALGGVPTPSAASRPFAQTGPSSG